MPKISIVTPVYNGEAFLLQAIASVLDQTCEDWEWIIVNDGSTDGTKPLLDGLGDPRITVLHQQNTGVSAARNAGLAAARGDSITFLDADDTLPRDALELRAGLLDREPKIDIVHGAVRIIENDRELRIVQPDLNPGSLQDRMARLEQGVFFSVCYMLRRKRVGSHRFQTGLSHCEDLIFFLTLAHDAELRYAAVPEPIYEYHLTAGSAMSDLDGLEVGYLQLLRSAKGMEHISDDTQCYLRRRVTRILFRSWLRRGRPLRAIAALWRVAKVSPR